MTNEFHAELRRTRAERAAWKRHDSTKFDEVIGISEYLSDLLVDRQEATVELEFSDDAIARPR